MSPAGKNHARRKAHEETLPSRAAIGETPGCAPAKKIPTLGVRVSTRALAQACECERHANVRVAPACPRARACAHVLERARGACVPTARAFPWRVRNPTSSASTRMKPGETRLYVA
eukprot:4863554-Pleurochrysis_carterae.AAC.3